jgi:hypothetical protein
MNIPTAIAIAKMIRIAAPESRHKLDQAEKKNQCTYNEEITALYPYYPVFMYP